MIFVNAKKKHPKRGAKNYDFRIATIVTPPINDKVPSVAVVIMTILCVLDILSGSLEEIE